MKKDLTLKILKCCCYVMDYHKTFQKKENQFGVTALIIFQER